MTFYISGKLYGIDITMLKEVVRHITCLSVASTAPEVKGIFNMRGNVVTVLDLIKLLKIEEDASVDEKYCYVLKEEMVGGDYIGFLADEPGDVIEIKSMNEIDKEIGEYEPIEIVDIDNTVIRLVNGGFLRDHM